MVTNFLKEGPLAGRMSGDKRREHILDAAVEVFSRHGFSGTTTREIARASGISEAMLFKHFATKDELYKAILDNKACQSDMQFPWSENSPVTEAIARKDDFNVFYHLALNAMEKHQSDVGFMRLLFYSALEEHEIAQRFFNEFVSKVYEFIGSYIDQRQKDGVFRELDPKTAVRAFLGMMIHHSLNNILWDKKRVLLDISNEDAARNFAEILLIGIKK